MILTMWFSTKHDSFPDAGAAALSGAGTDLYEESGLLKTVGWVSAALGAVALGLMVGRELRQRYKFNRRTPYDLYSHSGDGIAGISDLSDAEFGVGI
ncbi:MAG: hypothetical protein M3O02_04080 [Acidobacteriota bacterium]|nr:hypothetical protein [Acidobacteriota bacterium]